jgi:chromosome segregation ATPase
MHSDPVSFEKKTSLEEKFHILCDKIRYYFKKIETYDEICNRFAKMELSLAHIRSETESCVRVCNSLSVQHLNHESNVSQLNVRVTEESTRRDAKEDVLFSKLEDLHVCLEEHKIDQRNKIESVNQEFQTKINEHMTLEDAQGLLRFFKQNLEILGSQIGKASLTIEDMQREVAGLKSTVSTQDSHLLELSKENCRLRNALVKQGVTS